MTREIYVQQGQRREIAVTEDGKLVEYLLEDGKQNAAENIYLGRVERVVSGMQAAFVDIGQEKNGFLPLEERSATFEQTRLQPGMHVCVQVKKEAQGVKGAFLTRDVSLCGRYVIVMPFNRYLGVSARVTEDKDKQALRETAQEIAHGAFGLVMRHAALEADAMQVREEAQALMDTWLQVKKNAATAKAPSLLYRPRTLLESLLDDEVPRGVDRVVTDDAHLQVPGVQVEYTQPGLMERFGLTAQRDKALERRVWLDCGGNLVIDECEAMTVIDVNTAKNTGDRALEETILRTNLEAAEEIARQVRLRNLGGVILIDMIDMAREEDRQRMLEALEKAFAYDRVKTVIHGLTSLGLVEMTRRKTRVPLAADWTERCAHCRGLGRVMKEGSAGAP